MKKLISLATVLVLNLYAGAVTTTKCMGCHGAHFEKKALGVSKVVKDLNETEIVTSLKGYKEGTYGGPMKGIMKGQVANYSDEEIIALADLIKPKDGNTSKVLK